MKIEDFGLIQHNTPMAAKLERDFLFKASLLVLVIIASSDHVSGKEICGDVLTNCDDYDSSICVADRSWAEKNCAKTCGLCKDPVCPEDWSYYKNKTTCIRVFTDKKLSWSDARKHCKSEGGDLVMVKDQAMTSFIVDGLDTSFFAIHWIGLRYVEEKGDYLFVDGSTMDSYHPWQNNDQDNGDGCVGMANKLYSGHWADIECSFKCTPICQRPSKE